MNSNDRANLIKRINTLEGLTDKERSALLGLLRENKIYGLVWEDKPEDVEERLRDELPILTEVPERAIISEDKDAPNHILIEGDNLEALATLAYTHEGKIDVSILILLIIQEIKILFIMTVMWIRKILIAILSGCHL